MAEKFLSIRGTFLGAVNPGFTILLSLEHCAPLPRFVIVQNLQSAMHGRESLEESIITNRHFINLHQSDDRDIGFYFFHQSGDRDFGFFLSYLKYKL